jgi:hypothetical protein
MRAAPILSGDIGYLVGASPPIARPVAALSRDIPS